MISKMDTLSALTRIITFTGAHGTGKTVTKNKLVKWMRNNGYVVMDHYSGVNRSIARDAKEFGFTINERTTFEAQYYIASRYIVADIETRKNAEKDYVDFVVLDRSVLDNIPYVMVADFITEDQKLIIKKMLIDHFALFPSRLIYCQLLSFVISDSDRSDNSKFQELVAREFKNVIERATQLSNVFILKKGSIEDRLQWIIDELGIGNGRIRV